MDEETRRSGAGGTEDVACALCRTPAGSENAPPTWLCSVEDGSRRYYCDDCARTHIRAIEGRLDSAWW